MNTIDILAIGERARQLRAAEIQRLSGLFAQRVKRVAKLTGESATAGARAFSEMLRHVFSWNPQAR